VGIFQTDIIRFDIVLIPQIATEPFAYATVDYSVLWQTIAVSFQLRYQGDDLLEDTEPTCRDASGSLVEQLQTFVELGRLL
jgi:hypothetical protein